MLAATMLVLLPVRVVFPAMLLITAADCVFVLGTGGFQLAAVLPYAQEPTSSARG